LSNPFFKQNIVVVGATSGIARAVCVELAGQGANLVLAGRNIDELEREAADLRIRGQNIVFVEKFDAEDFDTFAQFWNACAGRFAGGINGVMVCHGLLPEQKDAQRDTALLRKSFDVNLTSVAALLEVAANYFAERRTGFIAAISSVAGDRGRQSNYLYGAPKAGLSAYLQGLRNRLQPTGVHVLTIKPGFVATRMTYGKVKPNSPLLATPEKVARQICRAIARRKNAIYIPRIWRLIMMTIRTIPEPIFKRMKL
jgi:decaprenylphospho-beta-D-erythro-pentofuranosid-2-ulose 2-reductase